MIEIKKNLQYLINELRKNNNTSVLFFEKIFKDLEREKTKNEAIEQLKNCFSIVQHANFTYKQEQILFILLNELNE